MNLLKKFLKHLVVITILGYPVYYLLHTAEVLNPLKRELADFKFTDIYFGHIQEKIIDEDIYLIDIGMKDKITTRSEIADFINTVNKKYKPKAIALDVDFKYDASIPSEVNSKLVESLSNNNIIMSYSLDRKEERWLKQPTELPLDYNIVGEGYTNNLIYHLSKINKSKIQYGVERFFKPFVVQGNDTLKHFSVSTAEKYSDNSNKSLLKDEKQVMINFKYKYNNPISIGDTNFDYNKLKDKIVVIGIFTKNKNDNPLYNEDVHYTSSNTFYLGKSPPDMYGGEVMASIMSNIKNDSFVKYYKSLSFWNIIFSLLIYLNLLYFMGKSHNIFAATAIITQFGLVSLLIFISVFFVSQFNIYLDLTVVGIIAFFSVEFVEPIDKIIKFVESKLKSKTHNKGNISACSAISKSTGVQCRNKTKSGSMYCGVHSSNNQTS